jgi:hypothetical protein
MKNEKGVMKLRGWTGMLGLLLLVLAVNAGVWAPAVLSWTVLLPVACALLFGGIWLALSLSGASFRSPAAGRAAGGLNAVIASLVFLGICMVIYAFFESRDYSVDLTREGRRSLSAQTVRVLQAMPREVEVICLFMNADDDLVRIARDKTLRFLDLCGSYTNLLHVEELDPHIDRTRIAGLGVTHVSPQGTIILKAGTRQKVITLSGGSPRLEEREFTNALINVLRATEPKVCFLTGHGERDILEEDPQLGASMFRNLLIGESYQPEKISISIADPHIPIDCDILVIHNLQDDLHPEEIKAIDAFLDRGGRLLVLLDPWRAVKLGASGREHLRPWLEEEFGIAIGSDFVYTPDREDFWQVELRCDDTPFLDIDEGTGQYRGSYYLDHPITRGFEQTMLLAAARTVSRAADVPENIQIQTLLRTFPDAYAETDVEKLFETGDATREPDEKSGPLSVAVVAAKRLEAEEDGAPRDARVVVAGDSDLAANNGLQVPGNLNFIFNTMAWLSEDEELIAIRATGKADPPLILSRAEKRAVIWISTLLTLQAVVLAGCLAWLVRRKHQ